MKRLLPLLLCLPLLLSCGDPRAQSAAAFNGVAARIVDRWLALHPERRYELHGIVGDDLARRYSEAGIRSIIDFAHAALDTLAAIDTRLLPADERVDYEILTHAMDAELLTLHELGDWRHDPAFYDVASMLMDVLGECTQGRPHADAVTVLHALPQVLAAARHNLEAPPQLATRNAMQRIDAVLREMPAMIDTLEQRVPAEEWPPVALAADAAMRALKRQRRWIADTLMRRSTPEFRCGKAQFDQRLSLQFESEHTSEEILSHGQVEFLRTQEALYQACRELYLHRFPDRELDETRPNTRTHVISTVLSGMETTRVDADSIMQTAERFAERARQFLTALRIITQPRTTFRIEPMPAWRSTDIPATCEPCALSHDQSVVHVSLPPEAASPWQRSQWMRNHNRHSFEVLLAHEAIPGHALQQTMSAPATTLRPIRAVFPSRLFAEGWACHAEALLADLGFDGIEYRIAQLTSRLRIIANAILDQKIHIHGMREQEAVSFLMNECYQDAAEAQARVQRIALAPVWMTMFYEGLIELNQLQLRHRASKLLHISDRRFYDRLLTQGTIAFRHHARLMGLVTE